MARTVDRAAHTVRQDAFLDAAERLIRTCGYDQMTVQDVLDEVGASKGAFYHYFDSKEALLQAVIERMVETAIGVVEPIVAAWAGRLGRYVRVETARRVRIGGRRTVILAVANPVVAQEFRPRLPSLRAGLAPLGIEEVALR